VQQQQPERVNIAAVSAGTTSVAFAPPAAHLPPRHLDRSATANAIGRLDRAELALLMREGWFALRLPGGQMGHAATDARSGQLCQAAGHRVTARANRQDVIDAILRQSGKRLTHAAANRLADRQPYYSARGLAGWWARLWLMLLLAALTAFALLLPEVARPVATTMFSVLFTAVSGFKLASLFMPGKAHMPAGPRLRDADLPVYTVLVPLFGETRVLPQIIASLKRLDYPAARLDVKILVEENDLPTRSMGAQLVPGTGFDVITVAAGKPQTKPRALNLGLMFARGDLVTIYDAEDIPQPMQLRLAAQCFAAAPPEVACLQARLAYYNSNENWLTRQFTIEYASLFDLLLPLLARFGLPLPLGGTSNHFRYRALKAAGGWDAWNVTEDADLGLRLARLGYRSQVLNSTTFEEANCRLGNWLHQRARWLKGWMQTWLVIMAAPLSAWRGMGAAGFLTAQVLMAGMIGSALLHPVFLLMLLHDFVLAPQPVVGLVDQTYRTTAITVLVSGYGVAMLAGLRAMQVRRLHALMPAVLTMPVYWLLVSAGGWLALWQLIRAPFHWNKTRHGISRVFRQ
jgi:cellulose synthase/poly-beta-1,6-N-acetylglucosamine synthase-like glycosyltransferase